MDLDFDDEALRQPADSPTKLIGHAQPVPELRTDGSGPEAVCFTVETSLPSEKTDRETIRFIHRAHGCDDEDA